MPAFVGNAAANASATVNTTGSVTEVVNGNMLVVLLATLGQVTGISIAAGASPMSLYRTKGQGTYSQVSLWQLFGAPQGSQNVVASWSGSSKWGLVALAIQRGLSIRGFGEASGQSQYPGTTVATALGDLCLGFDDHTNGPQTDTGGQTHITSAEAYQISGEADSYLGVAGNRTFSWTATGSDYWSAMAISIIPALMGSQVVIAGFRLMLDEWRKMRAGLPWRKMHLGTLEGLIAFMDRSEAAALVYGS